MADEFDLRPGLGVGAYAAAFDALVARARGLPGVQAIGRFGRWGDPGVSDIDALLVVDDGKVEPVLCSMRRWIASDPDRAYLYWHPPLVLSRAGFRHAPILHSLDGLEWIDPPGDLPPPATDAHRAHLDVVWATYITVIAARLRHDRLAAGTRGRLLVLKNLDMAVERLARLEGESSRALDRSRVARRRCVAALSGEGQQRAEASRVARMALAEASDQVMDRLTAWAERRDGHPPSVPDGGVWVRPDVRVERGRRVGLTVGPVLRIEAHTALYDGVLGPWLNPRRAPEVARAYRRHVEAVARISRAEGVPYPFVRPFDYPVEESQAKRLLRRVYWTVRRRGRRLP